MRKIEQPEQLVYTGFVLGLKVAEHLNGLPDNCTVANPTRFLEYLSAVGHSGGLGGVVPPLVPPKPTDSEADEECGFDDIMMMAATQVFGAIYALREAE